MLQCWPCLIVILLLWSCLETSLPWKTSGEFVCVWNIANPMLSLDCIEIPMPLAWDRSTAWAMKCAHAETGIHQHCEKKSNYELFPVYKYFSTDVSHVAGGYVLSRICYFACLLLVVVFDLLFFFWPLCCGASVRPAASAMSLCRELLQNVSFNSSFVYAWKGQHWLYFIPELLPFSHQVSCRAHVLREILLSSVSRPGLCVDITIMC